MADLCGIDCFFPDPEKVKKNKKKPNTDRWWSYETSYTMSDRLSRSGRKRRTLVWRSVGRPLKGGKKHRKNRKKYSRRFREHARVKLCRTIFHRAANRSGRPRRTRPRTGQKYSLNHSGRRRYNTIVPAVFPPCAGSFLLFYNNIRGCVLLLSLSRYYVIRMIGRPFARRFDKSPSSAANACVRTSVFDSPPPAPACCRNGDGETYKPNVRTFSFLQVFI